MNAEHRIRLIRVIEKIEKNPEYSKKLGIKDKTKKGKSRYVIIIVYNLYVLGVWKVTLVWNKSHMGNFKNIINSCVLPIDSGGNGTGRNDLSGFYYFTDNWSSRNIFLRNDEKVINDKTSSERN